MACVMNKTAVITRGTTGIGFVTAGQFIAERAQVIITGQNDDHLQTAAHKLGSKAIPVHVDVPSMTDLDALATRVKEEFGSLNILFGNAGLGLVTFCSQPSNSIRSACKRVVMRRLHTTSKPEDFSLRYFQIE